jgi:hypothetical protein
MSIQITSLVIVVSAAVLVTVLLFVAAVRAIRREDGMEWIGSPTLNGSPGSGRRSGRLRRAA